MKPHVMPMTVTAMLLAAAAPASLGAFAKSSEQASQWESLPKIAEVDPRFQSYNVEMVEVTGGRFWAPYGGPPDELYRMRPPEDLSDPKLRALAKHLGPSYMRVSGTWANTTYVMADGESLNAPPTGYQQILTQTQWKGVVDFAKAVNAKIGVSYAVGEGTRGPDGVWKTDQAQRLHDLTRRFGGEIAFAEFINEPNAATLGGLPKGYKVADYVRDFNIFRAWAQQAAPSMRIVGPGGVGEGAGIDKIPVALLGEFLLTEKLMEANPNSVDIVSYNFYGAVSQRCAGRSTVKVADKAEALSPEWLDLTLRDYRYYGVLRDRFEPDDSLWITETAQAACGGSPWASNFVDSFRYTNQLGLLAQKGVKVVFHNTLVASDYALIDQDSKAPRPSYWAAVLWGRTMGTKVLASPASPSSEVRIYAHCLPGSAGGIGLAAINLGKQPQAIDIPAKASIWTLTADSLDSKTVKINGRAPALSKSGNLVGLNPVKGGKRLTVPGHGISFVTAKTVANGACQ